MLTLSESDLSKNVESARLISVYRKRARRYDRSTILLYFLGFRHEAYRERAIECLDLKAGDTVVDLGCGTGLSFSLLRAKVGPCGRVIGVDLTDAMLQQARARVAAHGWSNIQLVKSDMTNYVFPEDIDGIISAFALTLTADFDDVIRRGAQALRPDKRLVILDFKRSSGRFMNMIAPMLAWLLTGAFGGTIEMASRRPWETLTKYLLLYEFTNLYFGGAYIAVGKQINRVQ